MENFKSGGTPLLRIDEFCRRFKLPNLLVKDESKNPFGTWKDRRSERIVQRAENDCVDKLCLITSGNAGFSIAKFAKATKLKIVSVIGTDLQAPIKETLQEVCYQVLEADISKKVLNPEEVVAMVRESDEEVIWNVSNGFHEAYESIVDEIEPEEPDFLICPVGSGEAFVGLYDGLQKTKMKATLIGVSAEARPSFADKLHTPWTPYSAKIRSILQGGHKIIRLSEEEIRAAFVYAKDFIDCEPSSAVVVGAVTKLNFKESDKVIVINSGNGLI